jgi:hypothetical protein
MFMDGAEEKTEHSTSDEINAGRHPNKGCGWSIILIVPQPRVSFHIDNTNNYCFSKKWIRFLILKLYIFSIMYYEIVIWVVKLFKV